MSAPLELIERARQELLAAAARPAVPGHAVGVVTTSAVRAEQLGLEKVVADGDAAPVFAGIVDWSDVQPGIERAVAAVGEPRGRALVRAMLKPLDRPYHDPGFLYVVVLADDITCGFAVRGFVVRTHEELS